MTWWLRSRATSNGSLADVVTAAVSQVILKLHSRCNLACTYCYVYAHADQGWRRQPVTMTRQTIGWVALRIAEHANARRLSRVMVTLHGGEPLMAGADLIDHAITTIKSAAPANTRIDFTVQTNGLLLDERMLDLFARHRVRIGVSIDGGREANDRHRRFSHGGGSYSRVSAALHLLRRDRFRHLFSGLLCTVDVRNDPLDLYSALLAHSPPRIDFLLPHGNWTTPPPARKPHGDDAPYAAWLIPIFDHWYSAPRLETDIRLFSSIMALLTGGRSQTEAVGVTRPGVLVVETDGSIEQTDSLKTTADGMAATGLHVAEASFADVLQQPAIQAQHRGLAGLAPVCQGCEVVSVCGGGLYAHRYREGHGFANPTVYCPDQLRLINHIRRRLSADVERLVSANLLV